MEAEQLKTYWMHTTVELFLFYTRFLSYASSCRNQGEGTCVKLICMIERKPIKSGSFCFAFLRPEREGTQLSRSLWCYIVLMHFWCALICINDIRQYCKQSKRRKRQGKLTMCQCTCLQVSVS